MTLGETMGALMVVSIVMLLAAVSFWIVRSILKPVRRGLRADSDSTPFDLDHGTFAAGGGFGIGADFGGGMGGHALGGHASGGHASGGHDLGGHDLGGDCGGGGDASGGGGGGAFGCDGGGFGDGGSS